MALPKLNESPKFTMKVPSTGKRVKYRPYLVKEEKVLMMAAETQDAKATMLAIADTIDACCDGQFNKNDLTTFDVEYMFTKIRAKSSGETAKVMLPCESCSTNNEVHIDLEKLEIKVPKVADTAELSEDISIELRYPPFTALLEHDLDDLTNTQTAFTLAGECIKAVIADDERIDVQEVSRAEMSEFMESMTSEQFQIIVQHLSKMPKLEHDVKFKCVSCGEANTQHIEGMQSFF